MSINPARTTASAFPSGIWTAAWIYFTAPVLGMLLAAQLYRGIRDLSPMACPKLHHGPKQRCIFCGYAGNAKASSVRSASDVNLCKDLAKSATH